MTTGMWECPDFFPLSSAGVETGLDTSEHGAKYVLKSSLGYTYDYYTVRRYDESKDRYYPTTPPATMKTAGSGTTTATTSTRPRRSTTRRSGGGCCSRGQKRPTAEPTTGPRAGPASMYVRLCELAY
jgi:sucrose-6-phosphate hydrolase SacC (GH32 family)